MQPLPDPPCGMRFCRKCEEFLPISAFPNGPRRYRCRLHTVDYSNPKVKAKRLADPVQKAVYQIWQVSWEDSKFLMDKKGIRISQPEIRKIFHNLGIEPTLKHRIVPMKPRELLTPENVRVVSSEDRKAFMACWRAVHRVSIPQEWMQGTSSGSDLSASCEGVQGAAVDTHVEAPEFIK